MNRSFTILASAFLALSLFAAGSPSPRMVAHFINVGQGDATLLEFPCGAVYIAIGAQDDAYADRLMEYLEIFFRRRTDLTNTLAAIYITHPHKDHTFGLKRVVEAFAVTRFIANGENSGSGIGAVKWLRSVASARKIVTRQLLNSQITTNGNVLGLSDDIIDPLHCEACDPEMRILSGQWDKNPGWSPNEFGNNNNHSLVVRVDFGESSFLLTGDLVGGLISTVQRIQATRFGNKADLDLSQLEQGNSSIYLSPFLGGIFAMVLFFLFPGGFVMGDLFPKVNLDSLLVSGIEGLDYRDMAKVIVWSFLAGFAEKLVPDRLQQLAQKDANGDPQKGTGLHHLP